MPVVRLYLLGHSIIVLHKIITIHTHSPIIMTDLKVIGFCPFVSASFHQR